MDSAVPPEPVLDTRRIVGLRDVLAGGGLSLRADRELAREILDRWPRTAALVRAANESHRRAAAWAVAGGTPDFPVPPAAGVIFAAVGYPVPDGPRGSSYGLHAAAQAARPDALFAYADPDPEAHAFNEALLAYPDSHVSACAASARDPAGLLGAPEAQAILERGPVMVQLQLCAHWWPPEFAAWAVAEYGRLLPPGSTVALSLIIPGSADDSADFLDTLGQAGSRAYPHAGGDIVEWIDAAGLKLSPAGITDVRARELGWAAAEFRQRRTVARAVEAVAAVP